MPDPLIRVSDFSFSIGDTSILDGVSFEVASGEHVSIIGPNGAGKTTLLKCLNRILTGGSGDIEIRGRPLGSYTQQELATHIGYVPQAEGRFYEFTVLEFAMMSRYPHLSAFSAVKPADEDAVWGALRLTGTDHLAHRVHATLSGGERQKVFIASALAQEAQLFLLDEPTTFLDPHHQADILRILANVNAECEATILSVTHDINAALLVSDRILVLREGRVMFCGTAQELLRKQVLDAAFGMHFLFAEHPETGQPMIVPGVPR